MTEKEGILQLQPSGRWAICRPGQSPVEVTSGELFRIEVDGELKVTRMEFRHSSVETMGYYSVDGYQLRDGARAAIGGRD